MAQDSSNQTVALDDQVIVTFTRRELRDVELALRTRSDVEFGPAGSNARGRGLRLLADRVKSMRS